ncbi:MAG: mandelate racemase/muconate lactonizing enzyme family protein [Planctomycetota bacterium]
MSEPVVERVESFVSPDHQLGLVRLTLSDGSFGWGQLAPYNADITASVLHRQVAWFFLGHTLDASEDRLDVALLANHKYPWSYVCRALAGVDLAVWDLRGKLAGKPVAELLGGRLEPIRAYASSMRRDIAPSDEADRLVRLRNDFGFDAFKIRVGKTNGRDVDASPGRTETIIPTIRQALGDDATLMADANGGFSPTRAIEVGRLLEDHGYAHFEEPCLFGEWEQTKEVTDALSIDVACGEQDNDVAQFRRMLKARAMDIVQPDVCYAGGITRLLQIGDLADGLAIPILPHAANRSLLLVATHHLMCAVKRPGPYIEVGIESQPHFENAYAPMPVVRDGQLHTEPGPGWGVTIRDDWLATSNRSVSEQA